MKPAAGTWGGEGEFRLRYLVAFGSHHQVHLRFFEYQIVFCCYFGGRFALNTPRKDLFRLKYFGEKPEDSEMELLKNLHEFSKQELKIRYQYLVRLRRSTRSSTDVIEVECHLLLLHREMDRRSNLVAPSVA